MSPGEAGPLFASANPAPPPFPPRPSAPGPCVSGPSRTSPLITLCPPGPRTSVARKGCVPVPIRPSLVAFPPTCSKEPVPHRLTPRPRPRCPGPLGTFALCPTTTFPPCEPTPGPLSFFNSALQSLSYSSPYNLTGVSLQPFPQRACVKRAPARALTHMHMHSLRIDTAPFRRAAAQLPFWELA